MVNEPNLEFAVTAQRANLADNISNSVKGSQAKATRASINKLADQINSPDDYEGRRSMPPPGRGRNLDISI